ncbi:hypothetical protein AVEN_102200-1 [Araneus ventricosus]|uniref:Uncharacterized protein n=1 Tax=Araneus ventricosus TaxID=182803 RepID=A0A4Y2LF98_ARAVE|nr:hypothetical protein AVEN_102200-1 [Araneus ventricosus]
MLERVTHCMQFADDYATNYYLDFYVSEIRISVLPKYPDITDVLPRKTAPASNQADMVELPPTDATNFHRHPNTGTNHAKLQPLAVFKRSVLDRKTILTTHNFESYQKIWNSGPSKNLKIRRRVEIN